MNKLEYIVIHCSDTPEGRDNTAADIVHWHTGPWPNRGWRRPGYSDVVELDGTLVKIWGYNNDGWVQGDEVTNGARGYNTRSRHICYIGGRDLAGQPKDTRTPEQFETLARYCIRAKLDHPEVEIVGHNDLNRAKACPSFDVKKWFARVWEDYKRRLDQGDFYSLEIPKTGEDIYVRRF